MTPSLSSDGTGVLSAAHTALTASPVERCTSRCTESAERLDELVPRYLPAVPIDPFADTPLIYERRGDGYLLASVGQNGVYDGGDDMTGDIIGGEWQEQTRNMPEEKYDLLVRMPVPARKAADR